MNILIFGATGMLGQGVLRECLSASDVSRVIVVGRTRVGQEHPKLQQIVLADLLNLEPVADGLLSVDACFFCLGVSSTGLSEESYYHLTHDLTLAVATQLSYLNPAMTFAYVSGAGTDNTERGSSMWARVKGKTENDLLALPFAGVYLLRPSVVQPLNGIKSKTSSYRFFYSFSKPLLPLARKLFPNHILTTKDIGTAMLAVARRGSGRAVLEVVDIARLAR